MSRALGLLLGAAVVISVLSVGVVVIEEMDTRLGQAAIVEAEHACNANLPGDNWTIANHSVNTSLLGEAQSLLCTRGETSRRINVSITINLQG